MKKFLTAAAFAMTSALVLPISPATAQFSLNISVNFAPPALPVYDQPPVPGPDYIWAPGYWAWDDYVGDYFWIPGTWVLAPRPGLLWTPPWWGWQDGIYMFHPGYWAPHVGFYGGVPYGFGYTGSGYQGAYWNGPHVFYNKSVTNITNVHVTNVYNQTVVVNRVTNVSYNGGPGGIASRPTATEQAVLRGPRVAPTQMQQQHVQAAQTNRQFFASANHGRPPVAAAQKPAQFGGPGVVPTRQAAPYHIPPQQQAGQGNPHPGGPNGHNAPSPAAHVAPQGEVMRPVAPPKQPAPRPSPSEYLDVPPSDAQRTPNPQHGQSWDQQRNGQGDGMMPRGEAVQHHQNYAAPPKPVGEPHAPPMRPPVQPHANPPSQPHPAPAGHPQGHPKPPPEHKEEHHEG